MEDFLPFAGMIFSLLVVLIIAGSILLFPLTRRLGTLLEMRIEDRRGGEGALSSGEVEELRGLLVSLQAEVERVAERQQFTERLLEGAAHGSGRAGVGRGGDPTG
jgi:hypothetical protein